MHMHCFVDSCMFDVDINTIFFFLIDIDIDIS